MENDSENFENWVTDIHQKLDERKCNQCQLGRSTTNSRVPPKLLDVQNSAFLPKIISIGPYHRKIDTMYDHKIGLLLRVLEAKSGEINGSEIEEEIKSRSRSRNMVSAIEEETESRCPNTVSEIEEEIESRHRNMESEIEEESESPSRKMVSKIEEETEPQSGKIVSEMEEENESRSCNVVSETEEETEPQSRKIIQEIAETTESQSCNMVRLDDLVKAIQDLELKTRECYSKPYDDLSRSEFVRMMGTDGCFVLELLRLHNKITN